MSTTGKIIGAIALLGLAVIAYKEYEKAKERNLTIKIKK